MRPGWSRDGTSPAGQPHRHGNLHDATQARTALLTEVSKGRHAGTTATVEQLYVEWIVELRRTGRSPNTVYGYECGYERNVRPTLGSVAVRKVTTKMLAAVSPPRSPAPRSLPPMTMVSSTAPWLTDGGRVAGRSAIGDAARSSAAAVGTAPTEIWISQVGPPVRAS